jgi:hypothetical protein
MATLDERLLLDEQFLDRQGEASTERARIANQEEDDHATKLANDQAEFDNMTVKETMLASIAEAQEKYDALTLNGIENISNADKKAFELWKKNLTERKQLLENFLKVELSPEEKKAQKEKERAEKKAAQEAERRRKKELADAKRALEQKHKDIKAYHLLVSQTNIDANQVIIEDERNSLMERLEGVQNWKEASLKQLEDKKRDDIILSKGRFWELLRIQKEYNNNVALLEQESTDKTKEVFTSAFDIKQQEIEKANAKLDTEAQAEIERARGRLMDDLKLYKGNFEAQAMLLEAFEFEQEEIRKKWHKIKLERELAEQKILAKSGATPEIRARAAEAAALIEIELDNMKTDALLDNIDKEARARQKLAKMREEIISDASNVIAEHLNMDAGNLKNLFDEVTSVMDKSKEGVKLSAADILQTIQVVTAVAGDAFNSIYERNIEKLEEQKTANDEYYANVLDNEMLSEEQRSAIEAERDRKNAELDKKKRKEQQKQARLAKAFSIFNIALSTAQAVIGALAPPPVGLGPLGLPFSILAGALGAASIAAVLAQPIPKFEKGTMNAPEGVALVDEKVPEVHTDKNLNVKSYGKKGANLRYLDRGDKIFKSREDFFGSPNVIDKAVWNMNMESNGSMMTKSDFDSALVSEMIGMRHDMKTVSSKFEKIARRPIKNNVTVKIEDESPY